MVDRVRTRRALQTDRLLVEVVVGAVAAAAGIQHRPDRLLLLVLWRRRVFRGRAMVMVAGAPSAQSSQSDRRLARLNRLGTLVVVVLRGRCEIRVHGRFVGHGR
jgi:hypothetical protein